MITRNDYELGLYNGDIGITLSGRETDDAELFVYRKRVSILGSETVLSWAISRKIRRTSGLRDALWGGEDVSALKATQFADV